MNDFSFSRRFLNLGLLVAGLGTCHGQTPVLQTGGANTNVVAVLEQASIAQENAHVDVRFAWRANHSAHGFGIIKFSGSQFEDPGVSLFFAASGFWRVLKPGETPSAEDLAASNLEGEGQYALKFRVYTASGDAGFWGDYAAVWRGIKLSHDDFQNSKIVLSGKGLEIFSFVHRTAPSGVLFMVK